MTMAIRDKTLFETTSPFAAMLAGMTDPGRADLVLRVSARFPVPIFEGLLF